MTKYSRITGKVFGSSADPTGSDPEIGQFGSALAGTYNGTSDVATIQNLPAWQDGFIGAVTPSTQFPPLPEMTGFGKVLSYQLCYLLQQGVAEYDSGTTYYEGNWVSYNKALYIAKTDNFSNIVPTNTTYWEKFTGGSSRNLGEYVTSSLPLTDTTLHLADGSLLSASTYPEFVSYVANLYSSSQTDTEWSLAYNYLSNNSWQGIAYGAGKFVAVNYNGQFSTSENGTNWTTPATMVSGVTEQRGIAYNGSIFVCITVDGVVLTSSNGTSWSKVSSSSILGNNNWKNVTYGNGNFFAINETNSISYSSDGITWNSAITTGNYSGGGICYGNGIFFTIASNGTISRSINGFDWEEIKTIWDGSGWVNAAYNGTEFIFISSDGYIITTEDGEYWSSAFQDYKLLSGNNNWINIAYGNLKTVAISTTGYISIKKSLSTNVFTTEADWQTTYTTYGECGKYVYNSGANTVRIPLVNSYFTNTVNSQTLGNLTPASLPNIKGAFNHETKTSTTSGAFYVGAEVTGESAAPAGDTDHLIEFNASRSSSIYSDIATTVNTQSVKQLVYIVVKQ